jgi:hypothetical protein
MPVPEAAMNEDHFASSWKNQIGTPWQACVVQHVPKAQPMNYSAYRHLGSRVLTADAPHARAGRRIDQRRPQGRASRPDEGRHDFLPARAGGSAPWTNLAGFSRPSFAAELAR